MAKSQESLIRRAFVDVSFGQMHYRSAGAGRPLLLCHSSPGSSKQLESLISRLADDFLVLAPDTPGNGDSSPLATNEPTIADYSRAMVEFLDALKIQKANAYGSHTGSAIAIELAIIAPQRVANIILDGVAHFPADQRKELLEKYAQPFTPDLAGTHLLRAFLFCRDQFVFFPWYASDAEHRRDTGLSAAEPLHAWVVEVLKAATTYHLAYRAAFAYPAEERLAKVERPTLFVAADNDPLKEMTSTIAARVTEEAFITLPRSDATNYLDYREALASELVRFSDG